jgi:hypothetical protein
MPLTQRCDSQADGFSSDALARLEQAGLIEKRPLRQTIDQRTFDALRMHAWPSVRDEMRRRLAGVAAGDTSQAQLFDELQNFNHTVFEAMRVSPARYDWREGTLAAARSRAEFVGGLVELIRSELAASVTVMAHLNVTQRRQLQHARAIERTMLSRWMFGDPAVSRDVYHEFRLSDKELLAADQVIDTDSRRRASLELVQALVDVRRATSKHRMHAQELMAEQLECLSAGASVEEALVPIEQKYAAEMHRLLRYTEDRFGRASRRAGTVGRVAAGEALSLVVPGAGTLTAAGGALARRARQAGAVDAAPMAWIVTRAGETFAQAARHHHARSQP